MCSSIHSPWAKSQDSNTIINYLLHKQNWKGFAPKQVKKCLTILTPSGKILSNWSKIKPWSLCYQYVFLSLSLFKWALRLGSPFWKWAKIDVSKQVIKKLQKIASYENYVKYVWLWTCNHTQCLVSLNIGIVQFKSFEDKSSKLFKKKLEFWI